MIDEKKIDEYEHNLMKYKLANDALHIALWDMEVIFDDPTSPDNPLIWSQELRDMLGFTDEFDFPNTIMALAERFHPDDSARVFAAFAAHFNDRTGETPYNTEYRLLHKNGEYRYFQGFGTTLRNQEGRPLRVAGAVMDITERKKMEEEIQEANERTKIIMDASPIGTTLWNRDYQLIDCNKAYVRIFNLKNADEFLKRHYELNPKFQPDGWRSSEKIAAMVKKAFDDGECSFEWMHKSLDGDPLPCHVTFVRVAYEDDYAVAGYLRDLREQKTMMQAIKRRDKLLSTANQIASVLLQSQQNNFADALTLCMGMIGKIVEANRASIWKNSIKDGRLYCTQIYEWLEDAESQINKKQTMEISYDDVIPGWREILSKGDSINSFISELSAAEQAQLSPQDIKSLSVTPIFVRGQFWGYMGLDHCQAARKLDESELDIVRSCGLMIANALLRNEMIQDIQAANKAKSIFLSNMSHEMRTPMNAIIGMTAIGKQATEIERKNHALDKIEDASSHLLGIINDVLDMAKIEANKLELSPIEFDFEKMLYKVLAMIRFRAEEKHQQLTVNIDPDIPRLLNGDEQCLAQVITNILANAVKFTTDYGIIQLEALLLKEDNDLCELQISVTDNGIGMSPEQQEKMFVAFEQAESGISREYGGTGLGLVISKRIIELMNGRIWVESELGKGARFVFTIQVLRSFKDRELSPLTDVTVNPSDQAQLAGKNLLVVEDIEINREIVISLLEDTGLAIDCAENGQEALSMIEADPLKYDIVFMDLQMPKMDGITATRHIRELPEQRKIRLPIVAMTANVFKSDIEECYAAGMDDHLGKPLDLEKVFAVLAKYLA